MSFVTGKCQLSRWQNNWVSFYLLLWYEMSFFCNILVNLPWGNIKPLIHNMETNIRRLLQHGIVTIKKFELQTWLLLKEYGPTYPRIDQTYLRRLHSEQGQLYPKVEEQERQKKVAAIERSRSRWKKWRIKKSYNMQILLR